MLREWVRKKHACMARGDATKPACIEKSYVMRTVNTSSANVKYDVVGPGCGSTCAQTKLVSYAKDMIHFPQGEGIEQ
jgi:hypothetical protein